MIKEVRILMIDDDEEDFFITRDTIADIPQGRYRLDWVDNYSDGLEMISRRDHDVYLVDYRLGADSGLDLITQAISEGCEAPLILLTGQSDYEIDIKALKAGASDFLVKGSIDPWQLERAFRYSIEHARAMAEIKELNADLEKRVRHRTMVLEQALEDLEQSRQELRKALEKEMELNELKSRFVSMASHEFRTPLATILSSVILVQKYASLNDVNNRDKHIERIKTSVNGLTELLNDMLSISKLEEGKFTVNPEAMDVEEFVKKILAAVHPMAKDGQTISTKHIGDTEIFHDPKILHLILANLLTNAVKFTPGGKMIAVTTKLENGRLEITVSDEGIGIAPEDQKHLFERFFRGQNVTNIQGTGLGLNIVARYVELLEGTISVESELNKGTTFTINLPVNVNA